MELITQVLGLAAAILALVTAVINFLSVADGSEDPKDERAGTPDRATRH